MLSSYFLPIIRCYCPLCLYLEKELELDTRQRLPGLILYSQRLKLHSDSKDIPTSHSEVNDVNLDLTTSWSSRCIHVQELVLSLIPTDVSKLEFERIYAHARRLEGFTYEYSDSKLEYHNRMERLKKSGWKSKGMQMPQQGPPLSNNSQADEPSLSPVGSQVPESSTHQIADSQPPEAVSLSELYAQTRQSCIHILAAQLTDNLRNDYAALSEANRSWTSSLAVGRLRNRSLQRLQKLANRDAASVPGPLSQTEQSEDCLPASDSVQEEQIFVKEEIASLEPVPSVGEHDVYSKSNYFGESTQSSKHPPKEKEKLKNRVKQIAEFWRGLPTEKRQLYLQRAYRAASRSLRSSSTSVVVNLELGHTATERELPTKEGHTHDFKVYVQGTAGSAIEPFVSTVAFRLPLSYPRPIRARREPPFEINVSGCAEFTVAIYMYFRTKEEPIKIAYSYNINLKNGHEVSEARLRKLIFQNPDPEFRKKLLLGGGVLLYDNVLYDRPCEASRATFNQDELAASCIQSQDSNSATADADQSTVEGGGWHDEILADVYYNQQNGSFPSTAKLPCDSGHNSDMLDFYLKNFKIPSSNGCQQEISSLSDNKQELSLLNNIMQGISSMNWGSPIPSTSSSKSSYTIEDDGSDFTDHETVSTRGQ